MDALLRRLADHHFKVALKALDLVAALFVCSKTQIPVSVSLSVICRPLPPSLLLPPRPEPAHRLCLVSLAGAAQGLAGYLERLLPHCFLLLTHRSEAVRAQANVILNTLPRFVSGDLLYPPLELVWLDPHKVHVSLEIFRLISYVPSAKAVAVGALEYAVYLLPACSHAYAHEAAMQRVMARALRTIRSGHAQPVLTGLAAAFLARLDHYCPRLFEAVLASLLKADLRALLQLLHAQVSRRLRPGRTAGPTRCMIFQCVVEQSRQV